jgi:hypothetical protein
MQEDVTENMMDECSINLVDLFREEGEEVDFDHELEESLDEVLSDNDIYPEEVSDENQEVEEMEEINRTQNLKPLPPNLKYTFLDDNRHSPMIIGVGLSEMEEKELIDILKENKEALGWKVEDINGINLGIIQHRIHLEDEFHCVRELKRRLNPNLKRL